MRVNSIGVLALTVSGVAFATDPVDAQTTPTPAQTYADSTAFLSTGTLFPHDALPFPVARGPLEVALDAILTVFQAGVCDEINAALARAEAENIAIQEELQQIIDSAPGDTKVERFTRTDIESDPRFSIFVNDQNPGAIPQVTVQLNETDSFIIDLPNHGEVISFEVSERDQNIAAATEKFLEENQPRIREIRDRIFTLQQQLNECDSRDSSTTTFSSKGIGPLGSKTASLTNSKVSLSFGGSISSLNDSRRNADREADTQTAFVAVSKLVSANTALGVQLSFGQGDVSSAALNSTMDSDFFGITAFAAHQISTNVTLSGFIGYAHGTNELNLDGALGQFDTDIFSAGAKIQGSYLVDGFTILPDASVAFSQINDDSFLASNGVATNAKSLTLGTFAAGATVEKSFAGNNGSLITASFGLHGMYNSQSDNSLDLINGATIGETGFGVKITPSLNIDMANGGTFSVNGSYSRFSDVSDWSVGASLNIPLR